VSDSPAGELHRVEVEGSGRLDAVLARALPLSRSRLQALIRGGEVRVDGVVVRRVRETVRPGMVVEVLEPPPPPSELVAQDLAVPLLHVDDELVVVDKPAALVVHPSKGHPDGTLVNALLHLISEARLVEGAHPTPPARPGIVHRLDRGTSGVMVAARTPGALQALGAQFAARTVYRRYAALVWGRPARPSGTVDAPLGRHPKDRLRIAVRPDGRPAVTHYEVLDEARYGIAGDAQGGVISLVLCRLETGRTHQIRVHMHHIGLPLIGDPLYGRRRPVPGRLRELLGAVDHQLLHAGALGFEHPRDGRACRFETPPPAGFSGVLRGLGLTVPFTPA
jgi:23S rRNA pseudouridine1911/1915/1917 synthase